MDYNVLLQVPVCTVAIGKGQFSNLLKQFSGETEAAPSAPEPTPVKRASRPTSSGGKVKLTIAGRTVLENYAHVTGLCAMIDGNILVCQKNTFKVYNRQGKSLNKEFPVPCSEHQLKGSRTVLLHMKIGYKPHIVYLCTECAKIYLINPVSKHVDVAWTGEVPGNSHNTICQGPNGTLFTDNQYTGIVWGLSPIGELFKKTREVNVGFQHIGAITFEPTENLLITSDYIQKAPVQIKGIRLETGEIMWQIEQQGEVPFDLRAMCNDGFGNIFMSNFDGRCINTVDAKTGRNIRTELQGEVVLPTNIGWFNNQPKLIVKTNDSFVLCNVDDEQ